jgi:hypothetical protein
MGEIRIPASSPKRPQLEELQPEMEENKIPAEDQATESNIVPEGEATVEELPQPRGEVRQRDDQEPDQSGDGGAGDERESKRMRTEFIELYLNQIEKALAAKLKKRRSVSDLWIHSNVGRSSTPSTRRFETIFKQELMKFFHLKNQKGYVAKNQRRL